MAVCRLCKTGIKNKLREELLCDTGFIQFLMGWGMIQRLQDAYNAAQDSDAQVETVMDEIHLAYKDYCSLYGLDTHADNRNNKEYLRRKLGRKILIIPPDVVNHYK